jgi:hypothetical protein
VNLSKLNPEFVANTFILFGGRLASASKKDTKVNCLIDDETYSKNSTIIRLENGGAKYPAAFDE